MPFDGMDADLIGTFGELAMGNPAPIFYPETSEPEEVDGILTQSARPEEVTPGVVARLFVILSNFTVVPVRKNTVRVRETDYSIERIQSDDIGGAELTLREK